MRFFLFLCVTMAFLASPARAEENLVQPGRTVLNISANERQAVQQDLLIGSLRTEMEGADSKVLQDKINTLMAKALEEGKKYKDVIVSTDHYYVYPYDPNQMIPVEQRPANYEAKPIIWKGSQGIQLKSKNSEQLLKLMGTLQEIGFASSNLSYTLSPEAFEEIRDTMVDGALKKLVAKAKAAAKSLGKSDAELVEVTVDAGYPNYPQPMMMMARAEAGMAKDMAAPVASPGEAEINLTVSARAVLK